MGRALLVLLALILIASTSGAGAFEIELDGLMDESYVVDLTEINGTIYALVVASSSGYACDGYVSLIVISEDGKLQNWTLLPNISTDVELWPGFGMEKVRSTLLLAGSECDSMKPEIAQSWHVFVNGSFGYLGTAHAGLLASPVVLNDTVYSLVFHPLLGSSLVILGTGLPKELIAFPNLTLSSLATDGRLIYAGGVDRNGSPILLEVSPEGRPVRALRFPITATGDAVVRVAYVGEPILLIGMLNGTYVILPWEGRAVFFEGVSLFDVEANGDDLLLVGVKGPRGAVVKVHGSKALLYTGGRPLVAISGDILGGGGNGTMYVATLDSFLSQSRASEIRVLSLNVTSEIVTPKTLRGLGNIGVGLRGKLRRAEGTLEIWPNPLDANVYINGEHMGNGSVKVTLPAGVYNLTAVAYNWPAYRYEGTVRVVPGKTIFVEAPLEWYRGWLLVSGTPYATVYVDGEAMKNIPANSTANITVDAGNHTVRVWLDGYRDFVTNITVEPFHTVHLNVTLEPVAVLYLISNVPGTKVYINGTYYGEIRNNELRIELPPGEYLLTAGRWGYLNYTENLNLTAPSITLGEIRLRPAFGFLNVTSDPPGATVIVDGKNRGKTPLFISILQGTHELEVIKEGYEAYTANVTVLAERQRIVRVSLRHKSRMPIIIPAFVLGAGVVLLALYITKGKRRG
ncbi:Serine/threonine protein kinase [Thermococcus sp. 4557]|uniref:PEGA domain-containing protein n=1 Tax=Thermococcus sp. (strain CGMCC 1.5172 / 4557) TaxID=1042877 RepID=UPI000219EC49|nr:PEGA domain-containing protein [Thermococcus sp. 4557]AEK72229.1 Serine/threonine protein kinase [Thermococcus sp. 4557]